MHFILFAPAQCSASHILSSPPRPPHPPQYFDEKFSCVPNSTVPCHDFRTSYENFFSVGANLPLVIMTALNVYLQTRYTCAYVGGTSALPFSSSFLPLLPLSLTLPLPPSPPFFCPSLMKISVWSSYDCLTRHSMDTVRHNYHIRQSQNSSMLVSVDISGTSPCPPHDYRHLPLPTP